MATITEALTVAVQYQQAGHMREAEHIYRQVVQADPGHAEAWCYLGMICLTSGRVDEAVTCCRQALSLRPGLALAQDSLAQALQRKAQSAGGSGAVAPRPADHAPSLQEAGTYNRQGIALFQQGRLDESLAHFQQALRLWPEFADAHTNLGNIFFYQGKHEQAVACYQQAIRLRPDDSGTHNNLGNVLCHMGRHAEAVAECQHALRLAPDDAGAFNNLGNAFKGKGDLEQAVASYQQAVRLKPDYAEAHNNLGLTLMEQGKAAEAMVCYQQALRIKPDYADAYNHLGLALAEEWRLEEALTCYDRALQLNPDFARAHFSKGVALYEQGKPAEAVACFERSLRLKPDLPDAHWGRGLALLLLGNLAEGWPEYDWRWQCKPFTPRPFPRPLWDGSSLAGKTILLHAEQGLGDTMQFIRFIPQVKQRGGRILLECQEPLLGLLARGVERLSQPSSPVIDQLVPQNSPLPNFDVQAPLLSLPRILGTTLANLPAKVPYLFPEPELIERWRRELSPECRELYAESKAGHHSPFTTHHSPLRIGIAWHGNPLVRSNRYRSIPLIQFAPLARLDGVRLFSLQKGLGSEQLTETSGRFPIADLGSRFENFSDTAAALMNLDLIISMDTSIVHCAGALGRPVWVALSSTPEWRWLMEREDSPWYPTVRLFRQKQAGDWDEVFERITGAVKALLAQRSG